VRRLELVHREVYDLTAEIARQRHRLDELLDGAEVLVYRHEIRREMMPPRDGTMVYTLRGDRLVSAEYQRARR
jgi:hypothetical protein